MKKIFLICSLFLLAGASALATEQKEGRQVATQDSLILVDEDKLVEDLVRLVQAQKAKQATASQGLSVQSLLTQGSLMELVRLNLLFDLISPREGHPAPSTPAVSGHSTAHLEARIAQLEALVRQLSRGNTTTLLSPTPQTMLTPGNQTINVNVPETKQMPSQTLTLPLVEGQSIAPQVADTVRVNTTDIVLADFKRSVYFPVSSHKLGHQARTVLKEAAEVLRRYPDVKVLLSGYASPEGRADYNRQLAKHRLEAVAAFLEAEGISRSRLIQDATGIDGTRIANELARRVDITLRP